MGTTYSVDVYVVNHRSTALDGVLAYDGDDVSYTMSLKIGTRILVWK